MNPAQKALLEKRDGWDVGRDPRRVSRDELIAAGHKPMSPLKALRARCIDCRAGELSEVRRCGHLDCPAWPYRMGTNPWQAPLGSEAQQRHAQAALAEKRRSGARKATQAVRVGKRESDGSGYHPTTREVIHRRNRRS